MHIALLLSLIAFSPRAAAQDDAPVAEDAAAPKEAPAAEDSAAEDSAAEDSAAEDSDVDDSDGLEEQSEVMSVLQEDSRTIAVISNLDFGLGQDAEGNWAETEDFRWTRALATYLDALMDREEPIDLVIAGGLMNLWQAPESVSCDGPDCQGDQIVTVAESIVSAHGQDLALLGRFSRVNDNHVYIVPGARDGSLSEAKVWDVVKPAMLQDVDEEALAALQPPPPPEPEPAEEEEGALDLSEEEAEDEVEVAEIEEEEVVPRELGEAQITLVSSGYWSSVTGQVVVNPGKDLLPDARLIQKLVNSTEAAFPLVDNLRPFSYGVVLTLDSVPNNTEAVAAFLRDHVVTTSPGRRSRILRDEGSDLVPVWNVKKAKKRGHLLFVDSLDSDLEIRDGLLNGAGESWLALRESLLDEAQNLSVSEVDAICDQVAIHNGVRPSQGVYQRCDLGKDDTTRLSGGKKAWLANKIREGHPQEETMGVFIYGGSNEPEAGLEVSKDRRGNEMVMVYNSGSFQRAADPRIHRAMTAKLLGKADDDVTGREMKGTLRKLDLRHFPACYSTVLVEFEESIPTANLKHWYMPEREQEGSFVIPCDRRCGWAAESCR